ncbi:glycosyltransferase family 39 protein [Planctomycetota bacterium]|nr:glycosyltransferase family 39 protein [Planctomycetota bacterium]
MHEDQVNNESQGRLPEVNPLTGEGNEGVLAWANWKNTLLLVAGLFVVRFLYLYLLGPYELAGDEAQYWDWSRHPSWSYFTKGPGVAWTIWLSTKVFGVSAWAVRLPALVSFVVIMLAVAKLATLIAKGDERVGFFGALLVALCPPFFAAGQLMTIDEPFFACWALSALFAYKAFVNQRVGKSPAGWLMLLAVVLGVGFLYKYTIALLIPGFVVYAIVKRKELGTFKAKNLLLVLPAFLVFLVVISPVFIWNAQNDWITVKHLVGHLGIEGGDRVITEAKPWFTVQKLVLNPLEMVGTQIGFYGIPLLILTIVSWRYLKKCKDAMPNLWLDVLFLIYTAAPVILFYFLVSFIKKVQPNWPVAGFVTLLPLAALPVVVEMGAFKRKRGEWEAGGKEGKKPKFAWQQNFSGTVIWGTVAAMLIMFIPYMSLIYPDFPGMRRVTGFRADAALVQKQIEEVEKATGEKPILITDNYQKTAKFAFYLPGNPTVFCAQYYYGERPTDYDRFADTDLKNPNLKGRTAILIGLTPEKWEKEFKFGSVVDSDIKTSSSTYRMMVGTNYEGPKHEPAKH